MGRIIQLSGALIFVFCILWLVLGNASSPALVCMGPMPIAILMTYFGGRIASNGIAERRHKEQLDAINGER